MDSTQATQIDDIGHVIDSKWVVVKPVIEDLLIQDEISGKLIRYQINTGGRRVRPFLTLLFCTASGGEEKDALYTAAAGELVHNASLVVDDVIDSQKIRRDLLTTTKKFGSNIAWCSSVDYCASALDALRKGKKSEQTIPLFIKTLKEMAEGQTKDVYYNHIMNTTGIPIDQGDYIQNIAHRTSSLFEFSCIIGCLSGKDPWDLNSTKNFAYNYGIAFQLANDIGDAFDSSGGIRGKDVSQGKLNNIVFLNALRMLSEDKKDMLMSIIKSKGEENADKGLDLIEESNARKASSEILRKYVNEADSYLPKTVEGRLIKKSMDFMFSKYY